MQSPADKSDATAGKDATDEQQALHEKLHELQAVLDSLPQRLLWKDRDSVFRGCNRAAADELGLQRTADIVGKTEIDLHADAVEAEYLRRNDEAVMAVGQATYHADVPGKQEGRWLDVTKVPLRDADGQVNGLLIGYEDVSEERRNRFALSNFRRAVEQSSSAVLITDRKGDIEYVNPRFLQLYGYTEHEVLGRNPRLLKSGTTGSATYQEMWQALLSGRSWHGELLNRAKNGELYWQTASISPIFDEDGGFSHFLAIEDDITQRKHLEDKLTKQLGFMQTLMNALPHPVYFKDRNGIYRGCNRAMERALGLEIGGLAGKTVFDIAPPEIAAIYKAHDDELLAHPGMQAYETKFLNRDGTLHDILSHKATFLDEGGEVGGIIGSILDISELKNIEEELRQSELRFRTIANYTYNWENWVSPGGKLLWLNPAVERITGYTPEDCYAMEGFPVPLIHPDDLDISMTHFAESLAGVGHRPLEFRIVRKDGQVRWCEVSIAQVYDEAGNNIGHRSSIADVTDRRQAMDALHEARDMLQMVLDHIPQGVFWKDLDGVYLGGNAVLVRDLGLGPGWERQKLTDRDVFPVAEAKKFRHDDRKVMRNGKVLTRIEEQFTDSAGVRHWALTSKVPLHDSRGEVVGLLGTYADLTELKQLDAELRESEARLREITATAAEGIMVMDREGVVSFVNPEAENLIGRNASELLGQSERLFVDAEREGAADPEAGQAPFLIFVTTLAEKPFYSEELSFVRKDGTKFNVSLRATPIMRDGKYDGAVLAFHDITEQKLIQSLLKEALTEVKLANASLEQRVKEQTEENLEKERLLIQQSRSAAMGEMISNIAHQWRQPLSTLGLVVQNILLDYRENDLSRETLERYVETAQQCVMRMSETIDDFRDFFRPDKAKVLFSLHQAVSDSLRLLDATLKNNNIRVMLGEERGLRTFGHVNEFSQVILNVLANAKDALVARRSNHRRIEVELSSNGHVGLIVIRDNAGGIPEDAIDKIFDPYFTTKAGGTGIGLYMSKTIVEKHMGGSIVCRNTGEGAEFTISLPLKAGDETRTE